MASVPWLRGGKIIALLEHEFLSPQMTSRDQESGTSSKPTPEKYQESRTGLGWDSFTWSGNVAKVAGAGKGGTLSFLKRTERGLWNNRDTTTTTIPSEGMSEG
ncbi:hypothetical protein Mp_3g17700 [Marchantia polymorpha subsp. ruderalis]|uniref:Uncharacterized protein n=2 Tax=Marchantia polymorpha TaxID=3197 RepID=A0AAF6B1Y1_MARPO|nr:hypothetical protein MARPO_0039s0026 [Marchantia polymorpha]BBN06015.1 hypothetical protein Mp_3g17700 [Marchantia polymorpha subsp. ruderalis]|eukprot:PTQ40513.1 hypothetical protein MARPO_0039s0026 [Marchantia polymorpha]